MHMAGDSDASDYSNDESVPSFENRSFQLMSAVPAGLNLGKTKAAEEPGKENKEEVGDAKKGAATTAGLKVPKSIATPSVESLATASSEEYEQIGTPTDMESDQNGVKTRWFKGFGNE
ncbi:hypothetical protein EJ02DRAFT_457173 [Clathrospora elynae]|uniref:Uncharacterized protein n=1 Tax=Clathrospora elynae TaxID=706981 RepID=A0A6A5SGN1_9PLEO|nr:hypothetical protein EJ02DRAFT_457173 [Clathrospora elynae]